MDERQSVQTLESTMYKSNPLPAMALAMVLTVPLLAQDPPITRVPEQGFPPGGPPPKVEARPEVKPEAKGEVKPEVLKPSPVRPGENASPLPPVQEQKKDERAPARPKTDPPASPSIPKAGWRWVGAERRLVEKKVWIPGCRRLVQTGAVDYWIDACGNVHQICSPRWTWVETPGRWETRLVVETVREGRWVPPAAGSTATDG